MAIIENSVELKPRILENASRVVWELAWPAVALNSLQVVNAVLDRTFLGHLDKSALVAHGGATSVMFLMFSLAVAVATEEGAIVARAYGAENAPEYRMASDQSLRVAFQSGILFGLVTIFGAPFMTHFILPSTSVMASELMIRFLTVYGLGMPAIFMIQTIAASMRGIGDTKSPMRISGLQILLHILLNFILIFPNRHVGPFFIPGANLGLVGAGTALSISAWVAAIIYVGYVRRTPLGTVFTLHLPGREWAERILRIAAPAAFMAFLRVFSLTIFTIILARVPNYEDAIAALSISFAIESLMFAPAFGLSAAAGALVGQSLGAKNPARAEKLAWVAGGYGGLVAVVMCEPVYICAHAILTAMLGHNVGVIEEGTKLIHLLCYTEPLFCVAMVLMGAMQGAGDTKRPLTISLFALWGLRVPLALVLCLPVGAGLFWGLRLPIGVGLGSMGAWMSMSLTQGLQGILAAIAFKQGKWKTQKV